jgi:hypothetical protein
VRSGLFFVYPNNFKELPMRQRLTDEDMAIQAQIIASPEARALFLKKERGRVTLWAIGTLILCGFFPPLCLFAVPFLIGLQIAVYRRAKRYLKGERFV